MEGRTNGRKDERDGRTERRNVWRRCERLGLSLCAEPSFNGTVVSFDLEGDREVRKGTLEGFRDGSWKECGKTERWDLT